MILKILCVLDTAALRFTRLFLLKHFPQSKVIYCDSFRDGKKHLSKESQDLLFISTKLGHLNSYDFFKSVENRYATRTIIIDNVDDSKYNRQFKDLNLYGFINHNLLGDFNHFSKRLISLFDRKYTRTNSNRSTKKSYKVIVIGASTGGPETIRDLFSYLNNDLPPIVVALHIPRKFSKLYADQLNLNSDIDIKEAEHGDIAMPGQAFITPGDSHLSCRKKLDKCELSIQHGRGKHLFCPSVDVLFNSASESFKNEVISIILTGMGKDGAEGMLSLKKSGSITIAQDKDSCVVYGMPRAAYEIGAVGSVLSIKKMAKYINTIAYRAPVYLLMFMPFNITQ